VKGEGGEWGQWGEMTQTMYAHVNKSTTKKIFLKDLHILA
jgi:hypothetical protein